MYRSPVPGSAVMSASVMHDYTHDTTIVLLPNHPFDVCTRLLSWEHLIKQVSNCNTKMTTLSFAVGHLSLGGSTEESISLRDPQHGFPLHAE